MLTYTIYGPPRTKKNSQRIIRLPGGGTRIAPSAAYVQYERDCLRQLHPPSRPLAGPVNVRCLYYMPTRRRVDLTNLLEATDDILVKAGVLADDCATIVASHDGSRVLLDRQNPRVEIEISKFEPVELHNEEEGNWIPVESRKDGSRVFICPRCQCRIIFAESYYRAEETGITRCPNCGLKMKG